MLYNPPTGGAANDPYVGKNVAAGIQGSKIPPAAVESVQREIVAVITASGLSPTNTDWQQLLRAVRSGALAYFVDAGTVNAPAISPSPAHSVLFDGLNVKVRMKTAPTGPATLAINTLSAPIQRIGGSVLSGGEWSANDVVEFVYNGPRSAFQIVSTNNATPATALWHTGSDSSTNAAAIVATATPAVPTRIAQLAYLIFPAHDCAGATTLNVGFGTTAVTRQDASALQAGDFKAGQPLVVVDDGTQFRIVDLTIAQIASLIPNGLWHYGVATGSASAITVASTTPPIVAYGDGEPFLVKMPFDNAAGATIQYGSLAALPLLRNDGSPVQQGDAPAGAGLLAEVADGGTSFRLIGFGRTEVQRVVLNPTLYVRTDGSDSNNGSTNTPQGAFATIGAALAKGTSAYNFASSSLTIQLAITGTYASPQYVPKGTGTINIVGDPNNQGSYIVSGAGSAGQGMLQTTGAVNLTGLTLQNTGSASHTLAATTGSGVLCVNVSFVSTVATTGVHAYGSGGSILLAAGCNISGSAGAAFYGDNGGQVNINTGASIPILGSPSFSIATAYFTAGGKVTLLGGASVTGTATGQRYLGTSYGICNTNGAGPNAFPGTTAGSVSNALYS